jgi:hypothetical protein
LPVPLRAGRGVEKQIFYVLFVLTQKEPKKSGLFEIARNYYVFAAGK